MIIILSIEKIEKKKVLYKLKIKNKHKINPFLLLLSIINII